MIGDDVTIGAGAQIARAILWEGAAIGDGAQVRDSIVGMRYDVAAGAHIDGAVVANEEVQTRCRQWGREMPLL